MATLEQAIRQMLAAGLPDFPPGHPRVNTDRIIRYGPRKKAWYRIWEYKARNGKYYVSGAFGIWHGPEQNSQKIETDWEGLSEDEVAKFRNAQAEAEARESAKRLERSNAAARRAEQQWNGARASKPAQIETYLDRKGVEHEKGLRYFNDGTVIVPLLRYDILDPEKPGSPLLRARLVGLQKIAPDGTKLFNKGMAKEGSACRFGRNPGGSELILLAEGVATALTIRQATSHKHPVFVAFDAGNLLPVAEILRKLYPSNPILICADDDAYLEASMNKMLRDAYGVDELLRVPLTSRAVRGRAGELHINLDWQTDDDGVTHLMGAIKSAHRMDTFMRFNTGRYKANLVARKVGNLHVCFPRFEKRRISEEPDTPKLTDYNDLHRAEGLAVVAKQLQQEIESTLEANALSKHLRTIVKDEVSKTKRKAKEGRPITPPFEWGYFFRRFTLIYPTDTAWDAELGKIVKISAMKIMFSEGVIKYWLESPDRRAVISDNVVFDPAGTHDPSNSINLFRGMPRHKNSGGRCDKLIELLCYLCGEAENDVGTPITDWVMRWIAYPLQHVGAKMETAVVMHGAAEGTGKNLFWGVVRKMYGEYGSLITQAELESPYNAWMSQRLFMIANEVISRQELRHHVGRLKNYITESPLPISEKYLPTRYEDNHMNMVFLTNELHPLQISPTDRRYMVIRTPGIEQNQFYKDVVAEIENGGMAAFYEYLKALPCGDFDEHTKPLITQAKLDVVEMGLSSVQQFWTELHGELLHPLPYGPCFSTDLYRAYTVWAARNGVKNPSSSNRFSHEFMSMNGVYRSVERIPDPDRTGEAIAMVPSQIPQRVIFKMGPCDIDVDAKTWAMRGCKLFREAFKNYRSGESDSSRGSGNGNLTPADSGSTDGWSS